MPVNDSDKTDKNIIKSVYSGNLYGPMTRSENANPTIIAIPINDRDVKFKIFFKSIFTLNFFFLLNSHLILSFNLNLVIKAIKNPATAIIPKDNFWLYTDDPNNINIPAIRTIAILAMFEDSINEKPLDFNGKYSDKSDNDNVSSPPRPNSAMKIKNISDK